MSSKNVGIIGFGGAGRNVAGDLVEATNGFVEIASIVEPNDENYRKGCIAIGREPKRYVSPEEMLRSAALDGVVIASPNACHLDNLRCLEGMNIPVMLEKPLDSTIERICDVVRFSESYRAPIMVEHNMRYSPIVMKAKELIESDAIGKVCSVNFVQNCHYGNSMFHTFRRTMAGSGGMFVEKATHDFDLMIDLLKTKPVRVASAARRQVFKGDRPDNLSCSDCPDRLTCEESVDNIYHRLGKKPPEVDDTKSLCVYAGCVDVPDNEACLIEFENGVFGIYTECYFTPPSYTTREYEIIGTRGVIRISFTLMNGGQKRGKILLCPRFGTPNDTQKFNFDYLGKVHYGAGGNVAKHFYRLMNGEAAPFTTVRQAFVAEMLGYAATLAGRERRFVDVAEVIPPDLKAIWTCC